MYVPVGALKPSDTFTVFEVPAGGSSISLGTDGNGNITTLQFSASGAGTIIPSTPIPFAMGTWNYFDIAFKAGSGDGGGQVWVNGTNIGGNFSLNTGGSAGASTAFIGNDSSGHGQVAGGSIYFDDFRVATSGPIGAAAVTLPVHN